MKLKTVIMSFIFTLSFCATNLSASDIKSVDDIKESLLHQQEKKEPSGIKGISGKRPSHQRPSVTVRLQFKKGSANLTTEAVSQLKNVGQALEDKNLRGYIYKIEGHTCSLGSSAGNLNLSRRRASSAANYLINTFDLKKTQFIVEGRGQNKPVASNDTQAGRRENRRVVIINTLKSFNTPNVTQPKVTVKIKRIRNGEVESLKDGESMAQSDNYAVEFRPKTKANVYILQVDANGTTTLLFPNRNFSTQENPVKAGELYRIPDEGEWFYLDNNLGKEQIVVLAQKEPLKDPEKMCVLALNSGWKNRIIVSSGVKGIGGKRNKASGASPYPIVPKNQNHWDWNKTFKWRLSFMHR